MKLLILLFALIGLALAVPQFGPQFGGGYGHRPFGGSQSSANAGASSFNTGGGLFGLGGSASHASANAGSGTFGFGRWKIDKSLV